MNKNRKIIAIVIMAVIIIVIIFAIIKKQTKREQERQRQESAPEEWIEVDLKYAGEVQGELQNEYRIYSGTIKVYGGFWYLISTNDAIKKEWLGVEDWGVEVDYAQNYLVVSLGKEIEHLYYNQDDIINGAYYETKVVFNEEQLLDNTVYIYIIDKMLIKDMGAGG